MYKAPGRNSVIPIRWKFAMRPVRKTNEPNKDSNAKVQTTKLRIRFFNDELPYLALPEFFPDIIKLLGMLFVICFYSKDLHRELIKSM